MKRLNDDALLDKIRSLKTMGLIWIRLTKAEFNFRLDLDDAKYARKDRLCCYISSESVIDFTDGREIEASITIKIADKSIIDIHSEYTDKKNSYIAFEEIDWKNQPETFWGTGYFVRNVLCLNLFCTEKEMTVLQPLIFISDKKDQPVRIGCQISHPDHLESPNTGSSTMSSEYMESGWHQGVFVYLVGLCLKRLGACLNKHNKNLQWENHKRYFALLLFSIEASNKISFGL